jgi:hypothetical protein
MQFREILDRERENITILILTVLAIWYTNYVDFFYFKYWVGEDVALAIYCVMGIVLHVILQAIYQFFVFTKVKIKPIQGGHTEVMTKPLEGFSYFAMLDVEIPKGWEITDCYVTLEKIIPVYYDDRVLIDEKFSQWFSDRIKPEFKKLRWKNPNSNQGECKINIGEESNRESFFVGKINNGSVKDRNGIDVRIDNFEFCLCSAKPTQIDFKKRGLYEISLLFHWKRAGRRMLDKKFNGYIYSENSNGVYYKIFVREGNYNKDKDVPKPLLKKAEEVHEKPKEIKKRITKGRRKGKLSQRKIS